jgi:protoporphyrin/coproporphyrin ferrochelatase
MPAYLLVNFGGPRERNEIEPFLKELLCDRDVIRTKFPKWLHHWFFGRVAKKRALKICKEYERIGFSPIYADTEALGCAQKKASSSPVFTFHRYLPSTHAESLKNIEECKEEEIRVVPLFPQFCYGTTGSIARFFSEKLSSSALQKLRWIKSYGDHPSFILAWQKRIAEFLVEKNLEAKDAFLFFSAHSVPQAFIDEGDPYKEECERSFAAVMQAFPNIPARLAYQSKFGRGEWLRPYTDEECQNASAWAQGKKQIVIVPISFTSDHIETLFEIEELYLPSIRSHGLHAYRCPALNLDPEWIAALKIIAEQPALVANHTLIRKDRF